MSTFSKPKLIGLSGTNGAGKDAIGEILAEKCNYVFFSVTELLRDEARRRGLSVERENLRMISAEWRRDGGLGVLVDKALQAYQPLQDSTEGLVIASLRNPGEADRIHQLGGIVVWVDADPQLRYDRIQANAASRGRAEEDNRTFEQFLADEAAEMRSSGDAATLNMGAVKDRSDMTLLNEGNDLADLEQRIRHQLLGV